MINLLLGLGTMAVCLVLQAVLLVSAIRYYSRHDSLVSSPSSWTTLAVLIAVMLLLVAGNLLQLAIWAWVFVILEEFATFREAFYHSAVNFATLGYGDIVMSPQHRLLGPLEAINGVIMIGVSTATLMATLQDALKKTAQARRSQSS